MRMTIYGNVLSYIGKGCKQQADGEKVNRAKKVDQTAQQSHYLKDDKVKTCFV